MSSAKPVLPPLHLYHTKIMTVSIIESFLITMNNITTSMIITMIITITIAITISITIVVAVDASPLFQMHGVAVAVCLLFVSFSPITTYHYHLHPLHSCLFSYFFGCYLLLLTLFCCHHRHQLSRSFVRFVRVWLVLLLIHAVNVVLSSSSFFLIVSFVRITCLFYTSHSLYIYIFCYS